MNKLTDRQKLFVNEYLIDLNATQAAIRSGYSKKTANEQAARLLANVSIQTELQKRMKNREKRTEITQDRVLKELAAIGFSRVTDFLQVKNGLVVVKNTDDMDSDSIQAISAIKQTQFGIAIKLHDKVRALDLIGEHLGMWKDGNGNEDALNKLDSILEEMKNNANTEQETE